MWKKSTIILIFYYYQNSALKVPKYISYLQPETVYIQVTNTQGGDFKADEDNADSDGVITIRQKDTSAVVNYTFEVKARTYDCYGTTLRTIKLSVPKYNAYSKRQVCTDIPDYYLCQPYILYDVNAANFLDSVTKYKEKLTKENASTEKELQNSSCSITYSIHWRYAFFFSLSLR